MEISSTPCTLIEVRRGEPLLVEQLKQQVVMLEYVHMYIVTKQ